MNLLEEIKLRYKNLKKGIVALGSAGIIASAGVGLGACSEAETNVDKNSEDNKVSINTNIEKDNTEKDNTQTDTDAEQNTGNIGSTETNTETEETNKNTDSTGTNSGTESNTGNTGTTEEENGYFSSESYEKMQQLLNLYKHETYDADPDYVKNTLLAEYGITNADEYNTTSQIYKNGNRQNDVSTVVKVIYEKIIETKDGYYYNVGSDEYCGGYYWYFLIPMKKRVLDDVTYVYYIRSTPDFEIEVSNRQECEEGYYWYQATSIDYYRLDMIDLDQLAQNRSNDPNIALLYEYLTNVDTATLTK